MATILRVLIGRGESKTLEFKSTARVNLFTNEVDKDIELSTAKTVAGFLNSEGGILLLGVADDGEILGIERDLELHRASVDRFQNWLQTSLLGECLGDDVITESVRVAFTAASDKQVCKIIVSKAHRPVWTDLGEPGSFYVRSGNATKQLHGLEQHEYINAHWSL